MLIGPDGSPVVMPPRPPSHPSHPSSPPPPTASDVSKAKTALNKQLGGKSPNNAAALEAALRAIEERNAEITRAALARAAILLQVEEDEAQRAKAHQSGKLSVDVVTEAQSQIAMTHQFDDKTLGAAAKSLTDGPLVTNKAAAPNAKPVTVKQAASAIQASMNGGLTLEEAVNATRVQFGGDKRDEVTLDEASLAVTGNRSSAKAGAKLTDAEKTIDGQKIFSRSVERAANKAMSADVKPSSTLDGAAKTAGAAWHTLQKDRAGKADASTIAKDEQAYHSALASEYNAAAGKPGSDTSWSDNLLQIDRSWQADQTVTGLNAGSGAHAPSASDVQTSLKAMHILDDAKTASGAGPQKPGDPLAAAKSLTQSLQGVPQNSALYKEVMGGSNTPAAALKSVLGAHGKTPQDTLVDEGQTLSKYRGTVLFDALSKAALSNPVTLANLKNVGTPGKLKDIANLLNAVNKASPELAVALYQHNLQGKVDSLIKHGDPNAFASPSGETLDQMDDYFGPLGSIVDALGGPKSAAAQPVVNAMQKQFTTQQGFLDRDKKAGVIPGANTWDSTLCYARSNHAPLAVYQELIDRNRGTSLATSLEGQTGLKPTPVRKAILPDNAQTLSTAQAALTSALGSKAATKESMTKALAAARKTNPTISNPTWSKAAVMVQAQSDGTQWQQDNAAKIKAGTAKPPSDPISTAGKEVASYDLFDADTLTPSVTVLKNGTVALARGKPSGSNASNTAGSTTATDYLRGLIAQGMSMPEAIGLARVMMGGSSSNDNEVMQAALTVGGEQNLSTYYAHPDNPKNDPIQLAAQKLQAYKLFDSAALKSLAHRMTKNVSTAKGDKKAMQKAIARANADYTKSQHATAAAKKNRGNAKLQQAAAIALQTYHKDLTDALNAAAGQPSGSKWQTNPDDVDLLWKANDTVTTASAQPYLDKAAGTGENSPEAKAYYAEVNRWSASLNAQQVIAQTLAVDTGPSGNLTAATTLSEQLAGLSTNDPLYQEVMGDASITNIGDTALKEITDAAAPPTVCYSNPTQGTPTARLKAEGTRLQAYSNTVFYGQLLDGTLNNPNTKALFSTIGADVRSQSKPDDKLNTLARYMTATGPDLANALYAKEFGGTGKHDQVVQWAKQANDITPLAAIYSGGGGSLSPAMTGLRHDVEAMLQKPLSQGGFGTSDVNSDLNDTSHREGREYFQSGQAFGFDHIKAKGQFAQDIIGDLGNSDVGNEIQRETGVKDTGKPLAAVDPNSAASRQMKSGPDDQPWQGGMAFTKDGNVGGLVWQNNIHGDTTRDQVLNDVGNAMTGGKVTNSPSTLAQKQALDDGNFALYDPNKVVYNRGGRKTTLGDIVNSLIASEGVNQVGELSPVTVGALSMQWWANRDAQGSAQQLGLMDGIGADGRMLYVGPADTTARYGFNDWEKHSGLDKGLLMAQPDIVLDGKGNVLTGSAYMSTYKPNQSWWERNGAYVEMGAMVVASVITIAVQPETAALWAGILSDAADAYLAYTAIKGTAQSIDALSTDNGYRNGWNWLGLAANALGGLAGVGGVADRTATILSRTAVMDRTMPNLLRVAKLMPRGAEDLRPYELTPRSLALNSALFGTPQAAERTMAIIRGLSKIAGKGGARATLAGATGEEDLSRLARLAQHFKDMGPMGYIGTGAMGTNLVSMGHQGYQLIQAGDQASAQDWLQFVSSAGLMAAGFGVSGVRKAAAKSKATASSPSSSPYDKALGKQAVSDDDVAPNTSGPVVPADAVVISPYAADKGFGGAKSAQDATNLTAAHPDDGQTSSAASDQADSTDSELPASVDPDALSSPETLADVAQAAVVLNSISATAAQLSGTPAGGAPALSGNGATGGAPSPSNGQAGQNGQPQGGQTGPIGPANGNGQQNGNGNRQQNQDGQRDPSVAAAPQTVAPADLARPYASPASAADDAVAPALDDAALNAADQPQTFTPESVADAVEKVRSTFGDLIAPERMPDASQIALVAPAQFARMRDTVAGGRPVADDETVAGFAVVNGTVPVNGGKASVVVPERIEAADASSSSPLVHDVLHTAQSPVFTWWANSLSQRLLNDAGVRANGWRAVDLKEGLTELFNVYLNGSRAMPGETPSFAEHVVRSYQEGYASVLYPVDGAASEQIVAKVGPDIAARVLFRPDPEAQAAFEKAAFDVFRDTPPSLVAVRYFVEAHTESSGRSGEADEGDASEIVFAKGNRNKKRGGLGRNGEYREIRYKKGSYSIDGKTINAGQRQGETQSGAPMRQGPAGKNSGEATPKAQGMATTTPATAVTSPAARPNAQGTGITTPATAAATPPVAPTATGTGVAPATSATSTEKGSDPATSIAAAMPSAATPRALDSDYIVIPPRMYPRYRAANTGVAPATPATPTEKSSTPATPVTAATASVATPPRALDSNHIVIPMQMYASYRAAKAADVASDQSGHLYCVQVPKAGKNSDITFTAQDAVAHGIVKPGRSRVKWLSGRPSTMTEKPYTLFQEFGRPNEGHEFAFVLLDDPAAQQVLEAGGAVTASLWAAGKGRLFKAGEPYKQPTHSFDVGVRGKTFFGKSKANDFGVEGVSATAYALPKALMAIAKRLGRGSPSQNPYRYVSDYTVDSTNRAYLPAEDSASGLRIVDAHYHPNTFPGQYYLKAKVFFERVNAEGKSKQLLNLGKGETSRMILTLEPIPYRTIMLGGGWAGYTHGEMRRIYSGLHGGAQEEQFLSAKENGLKSDVPEIRAMWEQTIPSLTGGETYALGDGSAKASETHAFDRTIKKLLMHPRVGRVIAGEINGDKEMKSILDGKVFVFDRNFSDDLGATGTTVGSALEGVLEAHRQLGIVTVLHSGFSGVELGKDGYPIAVSGDGRHFFKLMSIMMRVGAYDFGSVPHGQRLTRAEIDQIVAKGPVKRPARILIAHMGVENWVQEPEHQLDLLEYIFSEPALAHVHLDSSWMPSIWRMLANPKFKARMIRLIKTGRIHYGSDVTNMQSLGQLLGPWTLQQSMLKELDRTDPAALIHYAGAGFLDMVDESLPDLDIARHNAILDPKYKKYIDKEMPQENRDELYKWREEFLAANPHLVENDGSPKKVLSNQLILPPGVGDPAAARQAAKLILPSRFDEGSTTPLTPMDRAAYAVATGTGQPENLPQLGRLQATDRLVAATVQPARPATVAKAAAPLDDEIRGVLAGPALDESQLDAVSDALVALGYEPLSQAAKDVAAQAAGAPLHLQINTLLQRNYVDLRQQQNNDHLRALNTREKKRIVWTLAGAAASLAAAGVAGVHFDILSTPLGKLLGSDGGMIARGGYTLTRNASQQLGRKLTEAITEVGLVTPEILDAIEARVGTWGPKMGLDLNRFFGKDGFKDLMSQAHTDLDFLLNTKIDPNDPVAQAVHHVRIQTQFTLLLNKIDQIVGQQWSSIDKWSVRTRPGAIASLMAAACYTSAISGGLENFVDSPLHKWFNLPLAAGNLTFGAYQLTGGVSGLTTHLNWGDLPPIRKALNVAGWPLLSLGTGGMALTDAMTAMQSSNMSQFLPELGMAFFAGLIAKSTGKLTLAGWRAEGASAEHPKLGAVLDALGMQKQKAKLEFGGVDVPRSTPLLNTGAAVGLVGLGVATAVQQLIGANAPAPQPSDDHKKKPVPDSSPTSNAPSVGPHLLSPTPSGEPSVSPTPTTTAATPTLAPRVHTNYAPSSNTGTGTGRLAAADSFANVISLNEPFDLSKLDASNRRFAALNENPENEPDFLAANSLIRIG